MGAIDWSNPDLDLDKIIGIEDIDKAEGFIFDDEINNEVLDILNLNIIDGKILFENIKQYTDLDIFESNNNLTFEFKLDYEGLKGTIGLIYGSIDENNIYNIDFIGNLNMDSEDRYNYKISDGALLDNDDIGFKIQGLILHMYEELCNKLQDIGVKEFKGQIFNKKIVNINKHLLDKGIIKKYNIVGNNISRYL